MIQKEFEDLIDIAQSTDTNDVQEIFNLILLCRKYKAKRTAGYLDDAIAASRKPTIPGIKEYLIKDYNRG